MGNCRIAGPDTKGELIMGGKLTVEFAADIRAKLIEAFTKGDEISVRLEEDAEADLSFLQVLCSAHRTALDAKKTFELNAAAAPGFRRAVKQAGYVRTQGCVLELEKDCLWMLRGEQ